MQVEEHDAVICWINSFQRKEILSIQSVDHVDDDRILSDAVFCCRVGAFPIPSKDFRERKDFLVRDLPVGEVEYDCFVDDAAEEQIDMVQYRKGLVRIPHRLLMNQRFRQLLYSPFIMSVSLR